MDDKVGCGLLACVWMFLITTMFSTAAIIVNPIVGFYIQMLFMIVWAFCVLLLIVPEIAKELRDK